MAVRTSKLLLLCGLVACLGVTSVSAADRIAMMRGVASKTGVSNFDYAGNENTLGRVSMAGVNGEETREFNLANLRAEVSLYETAQKARLGSGGAAVPLHILLDPNENWAYAAWGHSFRLRYPDGQVKMMSIGYIHLGEQFDYSNRVTGTTSDDVAANRELLTEMDSYYTENLKTWNNGDFARFVLKKTKWVISSLSVSNDPFDLFAASVKSALAEKQAQLAAKGVSLDDFDSWVEEFKTANLPTQVSFTGVMKSSFQFTYGGKTGGLEVYADGMPHSQFRETVARLMQDDLQRRKADPARLSWEAFYQKSKARDAAGRLQRRAAMAGINEALTHELAHMIHFEATRGDTGNSVDSGDPINRGSHSITTLSNPPFALAEGWAEAMAFTYGRQSPGPARDVATRIDYSASVKVLRQYLNGLFAGEVVSRLRKAGKLGPNETLAIDAPSPMELPPAEFRAKVREAAAAKGMPADETARIEAAWLKDAGLQKSFRRMEYLEDLQANKGQKKLRHDFLSSEASVSIVFFQLSEDLGTAVYTDLVKTMSAGRCTSLAELLEAYAHARPDRRVALYRSLSRSSDQILVTDAQVQLVEANPALELDLDRNGKVPGRNAATVRPDAFPAESISYALLPELRPGQDPLATSLETAGPPAASQDTVSSTRPDGITRRIAEETVTFDGMESR